MGNTHREVAHHWANQTGRKTHGYAMYYNGETIYSWGPHFPVARIVYNHPNVATYLITSRSYSVSTAKHKTYTRRAIPAGSEVYEVDDVLANTPMGHHCNATAMLTVAADLLAKSERARTCAAMLADDCVKTLAMCLRYAEAFGVTDVAIQERAEALFQQARQRASIPGVASLSAYVAAGISTRTLRTGRQSREQRHAWNKVIAEWLDGAKTQSTANNHLMRRRPFVRVRGDVVETTWGVSVPLADALHLYKLATRCRRSGNGLEVPQALYRAAERERSDRDASSPDNAMVGHFRLRSIGPTGNVVVGCHDIPWRHMQMAVKRAGLE